MSTHRTTCRVIYGDTDNMGQAYYGNYLRWFEMGRNELFRSMGLAYATAESRGLYLPVAETYCKYLQPAKYDDVLIIETSMDTRIKGGLKFDYQIFCEDPRVPVAIGYTKHACLNRDGKVIRPPQFIKEIIEKSSQKS